MSAPSLQAYANGSGQITGDNLNTFQSTCDTIAQLRAFVGLPGIQVYVRGFTAANDGGQGAFMWNASGGGTDNGTTNIVPTGAATGAWNRISFDSLVVTSYAYSVPVTGFSITIPNNLNVYIINPAGTLSTGTFITPSAPYDGQLIRITSSQTVTTLTITANSGQTVVGAPSTITSTTPFGFTYRLTNTTWYRI